MQDYLGEDHDEMLEREAADAQAERAQALLHADWSWCPTCRTHTLATRRNVCLFCDGATYPSPSSLAVTSAASERGATQKEKAA